MANLYEINQAIMECIDLESGEIIDIEKLSELTLEKDDKIENIALWIKNLKSDIEAYNAEIESFTARKKSAENKLNSLSRYLGEFLDGQSFKTAKAQISFRTTTSVKVEDGITPPDDYCRVTTKKDPDKKKIKEALEKGIEIIGCELVQSRSMSVK